MKISNFHLLKVGHCVHPEAIIHPGKTWSKKVFPAIVGLLQHPKYGYILFDSGYSNAFITATRSFPNRLYRLLTPMHLCNNEKLPLQLDNLGISKTEISHVFISHFHADHISGLSDFPAAKYICSKLAFDDFSSRNGLKGLLKGYLPSLVPDNFASRVLFIEDQKQVPLDSSLQPFHTGYDLFADSRYIAISLPGHAFGQFGLVFNDERETHFFVADACWSEEAYQKQLFPSRLTHIIMSEPVAYKETIQKLFFLSQKNKKLKIYPTHCEASYKRWEKIHKKQQKTWPDS